MAANPLEGLVWFGIIVCLILNELRYFARCFEAYCHLWATSPELAETGTTAALCFVVGYILIIHLLNNPLCM